MADLSKNLTSSRAIYAKAIMFVGIAVLAGGMLIAKTPHLDSVALFLITIWASCRAYYFAFYVIENYVDSEFRFSGLFDFALYVIRGPRTGARKNLASANKTPREPESPARRDDSS